MYFVFADHMDDDQIDDLKVEENKENLEVCSPVKWTAEPCNYDEIDDTNNDNKSADDQKRSLPKKTQFPSWTKFESFKNKKMTWPKFFKIPFLKNLFGRRGNDKKNPGLGQVLSPKALYPSGPPISINGNPCKIIQASSGGSSSSSMAPISNSSSGGSNSSSSRITAKRSGGSLNNNGELDLENLEYPDSPTSHKWFADNADLSPLTVLDNMNLKTEFPYSTGMYKLHILGILNTYHCRLILQTLKIVQN